MLKLGACLFLCLLYIQYGVSVDRNNFKTCDQSSFCRRCRKVPVGQSAFQLIPETQKVSANQVSADVINHDNGVLFVFQLHSLKDNTFRVYMNEKDPLKPRYHVVDALQNEPVHIPLTRESFSEEQTVVTSGKNKAVVKHNPIVIEFYSDNVLVTVLNAKGLLRIEHLRHKPESPSKSLTIMDKLRNFFSSAPAEGEDLEENVPEVVSSIEDEDPGSWEENFKGHHDSKPYGPEAVALDFSFPSAAVLFGIPEHADNFALRSTEGAEPYRLYNLDVFEYELDNGMALYGSVPVIFGHGLDRSVGIYWQNAAETWVDIYGNAGSNVMSSIVNFVSGSRQTTPLGSHFMSENGVIDVFIMLGPKPLDVFRQYTYLTGTAPLPPYFSLGYHQSRWNYNDELDVMGVQDGFDEYDIPLDVIWLDIEHTDGKKYFTWDSARFPHPLEMTANLTSHGRRLVVIVDPHIKRDNNYFLHIDATDRGYYVKNKDGGDYEGWCWPGAASYLDVLNPVVVEYYSDRYLLSNFPGTTLETFIWNDMNEPSVFNGPETTMLKDAVHHGNWEHRTVHNLYGLLHTRGTYKGLMKRSDSKLRPFILTRAHFSGTQRYAAVWTGDNTAEWGHLAMSIKMCLSLSVSGISFCGADVGGFFNNPDAELLLRWYQTAAFQPFFRAHAHIDTKRREPWLFPDETRNRIRAAIRLRYTYLPHWYTLFYEHARNGDPVMRPLLTHYPQDKDVYNIDNEYLLGDSLLVRPVTKQGETNVDVYFPGTNDIWYDINTYKKQNTKVGIINVPAGLDKIPVYQRGGSIIARKLRVRRASTLMHQDPYTLVVCLDANGQARGTLYIDDGKTFDYTNKKYVYLEYEFKNNKLTYKNVDNTSYNTNEWIERVVIAGITKQPQKVILHHNKQQNLLETSYEEGVLTVRKPSVGVVQDWRLEFINQ